MAIYSIKFKRTGSNVNDGKRNFRRGKTYTVKRKLSPSEVKGMRGSLQGRTVRGTKVLSIKKRK